LLSSVDIFCLFFCPAWSDTDLYRSYFRGQRVSGQFTFREVSGDLLERGNLAVVWSGGAKNGGDYPDCNGYEELSAEVLNLPTFTSRICSILHSGKRTNAQGIEKDR
jgi:hypothetical protein